MPEVERSNITDFGFAMVRPDALRMSLDEYILSRIAGSGLTVVKRRLSVVTDEQVDALYPNHHDRPYYPSMKAAMAGQCVVSLIVGGTHDVAARLNELKGTVDDTHDTVRGYLSGRHLVGADLQAAYDELVEAEQAAKHGGAQARADFERLAAGSPAIEARRLVKQEDRLHTDGSNAEAANSISVMFSADDIAEATERFPHLEVWRRV